MKLQNTSPSSVATPSDKICLSSETVDKDTTSSMTSRPEEKGMTELGKLNGTSTKPSQNKARQGIDDQPGKISGSDRDTDGSRGSKTSSIKSRTSIIKPQTVDKTNGSDTSKPYESDLEMKSAAPFRSRTNIETQQSSPLKQDVLKKLMKLGRSRVGSETGTGSGLARILVRMS